MKSTTGIRNPTNAGPVLLMDKDRSRNDPDSANDRGYD